MKREIKKFLKNLHIAVACPLWTRDSIAATTVSNNAFLTACIPVSFMKIYRLLIVHSGHAEIIEFEIHFQIELRAAAEMTDEAMAVFMLRHLRPCIAFLISSERLQRKYLKHMLHLFGQAKTRVRVQAILFIREMAVTLLGTTISMAMKVDC